MSGAQATSTRGLVESLDTMPTILDLCGVPIPDGVQGVSYADALDPRQSFAGRDSVLIQERHAPDLAARGLEPETVNQIGLRTDQWKLIHCPGQPCGELYDMVADPGEFRNLWANPEFARQKQELQGRLLDRVVDSLDPLPTRSADW